MNNEYVLFQLNFLKKRKDLNELTLIKIKIKFVFYLFYSLKLSWKKEKIINSRQENSFEIC
jgi:hypothetical protein